MLILASASPRRRELLRLLVPDFEVRPAAVDESVARGEAPEDYAARVASAKAQVIASQTDGERVLGADTVVVLDRQILGKPASPEAALEMLSKLSGRIHQVVSAVVLVDAGGHIHQSGSISRVTMASLDAQWIERYIASGEPMDKAGAYAIQGRAAACITRLEGSYTGVVGLPLPETANLLRKAGIAA